MSLQILFSKQNAGKIQTTPCAFRLKRNVAIDMSKFELKKQRAAIKEKVVLIHTVHC